MIGQVVLLLTLVQYQCVCNKSKKGIESTNIWQHMANTDGIYRDVNTERLLKLRGPYVNEVHFSLHIIIQKSLGIP